MLENFESAIIPVTYNKFWWEYNLKKCNFPEGVRKNAKARAKNLVFFEESINLPIENFRICMNILACGTDCCRRREKLQFSYDFASKICKNLMKFDCCNADRRLIKNLKTLL